MPLSGNTLRTIPQRAEVSWGAWAAAIPACSEPEVAAAQYPDRWTGEPSSLILNSALWCMGQYGAMDHGPGVFVLFDLVFLMSV
jgi:hypothetical protein